ncbi:hypothetical protein BRADI_5g10412v3 [Brachypodium distachyon]|uniref:Uncharacterized protein n=2 Tax=Brachypodium distachyon TaxID=15368 RepID=A0A2K2CGF2_BRADI|nr:hypothetical protein BRADI_5g10412v3 [Brachypodium distachyon]
MALSSGFCSRADSVLSPPSYTPGTPSSFPESYEEYTPSSPSTRPGSPYYTPSSPSLRSGSPYYTPSSPSPRPASPDYTPATPSRAASPDYTPLTPSDQHPASPYYTPSTPSPRRAASPDYTPSTPPPPSFLVSDAESRTSPYYAPSTPDYTPSSTPPTSPLASDAESRTSPPAPRRHHPYQRSGASSPDQPRPASASLGILTSCSRPDIGFSVYRSLHFFYLCLLCNPRQILYYWTLVSEHLPARSVLKYKSCLLNLLLFK